MYNLSKFLGSQFERLNTIIDSYNNAQNSYINLLACVSYIYPEVTLAMQYPLSTIPTEGLMSGRFFPLSSYMDEIEVTSEQQVLKLFDIQSGYKANIQPHSGTQANHIIYNAILDPKDKVLSMNPKNGGHISHTKIFNGNTEIIYYPLTAEHDIDYNSLEIMAEKHCPKIIIAGGSSYPRKVDYKRISEIAHRYNAYVLADISHFALFIAGGVHESIFPYVDFASFTMEKNLRGPHGGVIIYREQFHKQICKSIFPHSQGSPIQNMMFGKAVALNILSNMNVHEYAYNVVRNAKLIADTLIESGIDVITGDTDSHIILVNVSKNGYSGKEVEQIMEKNHILVNRNLIPNDSKQPLITSGIRIGSTPITNLDYTTDDVMILANLLASIITSGKCDQDKLESLVTKYHSKLNTSNLEKV